MGIYPEVDKALRQRPGYRLDIAVPVEALVDTRRRYPHENVVVVPKQSGADWFHARAPALVILGTEHAGKTGLGIRVLLCDDRVTSHAITEALPSIQARAAHKTVHPPMATFMPAILGKPIASLDELKFQLGTPKTILCLGNGPSSESPEVLETTFDCLFRVNWIWRDRGLLNRPALVMTGDPDPPTGSPIPILAFPNETVGLAVLWKHWQQKHLPSNGYTIVDQLLRLPHEDSVHVPSNGAIIIALAAGLAPRHIIVAGMDLYSHDQGRYPGDRVAVDGYSRDHDRQTDIEFIKAALAKYRGEITILSERLRLAIGITH